MTEDLAHYGQHAANREAFDEVCRANCYCLPDKLPPGCVVVDIGAHIGSFVTAVLDRGASVVFAYEADPRNFELLWRNVSAHPEGHRVHAVNAAVWRSDIGRSSIRFSGYPDDEAANTGGGTAACGPILIDGKAPTTGFIPTISLRDILSDIPTVHLLKLDCEGSEFPILYTANLRNVRRICAELHPDLPFSPEARVGGRPNTVLGLDDYLSSVGFAVKVIESDIYNRPLLFASR